MTHADLHDLEALTRDGGAVEYSKAADPVASGATPTMPVREFPPELYAGLGRGVLDLDLARELRCEGPATSPGLLASFVVLGAGEELALEPAAATSQLWFALSGAGVLEADGLEIPYGPRDLVTLPACGAVRLRASEASTFYRVHDAPLLRYLGVAPTAPRFRPTLYPWEVVQAEVRAALEDPEAASRSRVSVLLTNSHFPGTLTVTHVLWAMIGILPVGADQLPHRHQSVALDLILECQPGCYTLVAREVDGQGELVDPVRVPWRPGGAFTTPPGYWHSHHNESGAPAYLMPIQDAGLQTHLRALDIRFHPSTAL
jgi:gentisate 1,2-dioxygenase